MSEIEICIGNYSSYEAGYLIDRWAKLPMPKAELDALLADMRRDAERLTGEPSEEFYVSDYDEVPFGLSESLGEGANIEHLNILAHMMDNACEREVEAVERWCEYDAPYDALEVANLLEQADDIEAYGRNTDDYVGDGFYIPCTASAPDTSAYTWEELAAEHCPDYCEEELKEAA